jgi:hypothetical protein
MDEALAGLPGHLRDYGLVSGRSFEDRMLAKRREPA